MPDGAAAPRAHWRDLGDGPVEALAVHCSLAHGGAWRGLAQALSGAVRLRAMDLPGHGKSPDWDGARPYPDVACDMLRAGMGNADGVHLIGHSFGGTVALRVAAEAPERIASLTLIEPVFFTVARADHPEMFETGEEAVPPFRQALARGDTAEAARLFHGTWGDGRRWEDMEDHQREALIRRMPLIQAVEDSNNADPAGILAQGKLAHVRAPVLLIRGETSPDAIRLINDGLARRFPDARQAVIAGAAHMAPITHPDAVAAEVRSLMAAFAA